MEKQDSKTKKVIVWSLLGVVAFLWGISFLASTVALRSVEPLELLSVRWTVAAVLFVLLISFGIVKVNYKGKPTKYLLLMAFVQPCLYSLFELLGIKYTTTSTSSIVISLISIMVIIISAIFLKEHYGRKVKIAVVVAFLGVITTTVFAPDFSLGGELKGFLYLFIAITLGAIYNIIVNKLSAHYSVVEMTTVMTISGAVFYNIISLLQGNGIHPYAMVIEDGSFALSSLYLGIGCSFGAYFIYNYILSKLPPGIASCLQVNGITLVGVVAGVVVAGDPFGWYTVVGIILLAIGIAIASLEGNNDIS